MLQRKITAPQWSWWYQAGNHGIWWYWCGLEITSWTFTACWSLDGQVQMMHPLGITAVINKLQRQEYDDELYCWEQSGIHKQFELVGSTEASLNPPGLILWGAWPSLTHTIESHQVFVMMWPWRWSGSFLTGPWGKKTCYRLQKHTKG